VRLLFEEANIQMMYWRQYDDVELTN